MNYKLYNKHLFDNIRFPVGKEHEDEAIIHRVYGNCKSIVLTNGVFCNYRIHDGSFTQQKVNLKKYDAIDAYIDRTEYLLNLNKPEIAALSLVSTANILINLHLLCDNKEKKNKEKTSKIKIKNLYKTISHTYFSVHNKATILFAIHFLSFSNLFALLKK